MTSDHDATLGQSPTLPTWVVQWIGPTPSTNAELAGQVRDGCPPYTVVVSREQYSGRGRLDRGWYAPPGAAVAMSMAVPIAEYPQWGILPLVVGVSVVHMVEHMGGQAQVKWPNDVYVQGKKISGILVEVVADMAVVGVGINVSQSGETIGVDTAISLAMAGIEVPHEQVVEGFLRQFGEDIGHLRSLASAQMLLGTYRQMSSTLGREVEIFADEQDSITGVALDINDDGHLMVDVDGDVRAFASGDVFHCRPVDQ